MVLKQLSVNKLCILPDCVKTWAMKLKSVTLLVNLDMVYFAAAVYIP